MRRIESFRLKRREPRVSAKPSALEMRLERPAAGSKRYADPETVGNGMHGAAQSLHLVALAHGTPAGQIAQRLVAFAQLLDHL
jgi:hypothetical protein